MARESVVVSRGEFPGRPADPPFTERVPRPAGLRLPIRCTQIRGTTDKTSGTCIVQSGVYARLARGLFPREWSVLVAEKRFL